MTPERWQQIEELFHAAIEQPTALRSAFLQQVAGEDVALRQEVEKMLAADASAENATLELPAQLAAEWAQEQAGSHAKQLLHYRLLSQLGAGGMGEVYLAEDTRLKRKVAIKLLPTHFTTDADRVRRFEQEALAISALNHPNIITIHEIGETAAGRFLVMEHVNGQTLRTKMAEPVPFAAWLDWGRQIAKALAVAHEAGITHRDIKPENIMVRADGYVKVLDFGLARLDGARENLVEAATMVHTNPGLLLGTVKYMSPEQTRSEKVSSPTDIFALGIVFYELATGQHPFNAANLLGLLQAIAQQTPIVPSRLNPALPPRLNALLLLMLEKDARLRPTAAEVEAVLAEIARTSDGETARKSDASLRPVSASSLRRKTVGRDKERLELQAAFDAGQSLLLCVAGEPGMGKTTLVEEFLSVQANQQTCLIARGRCSERLAGTEAYLPLLEALEALLRADRDGFCARTMRQLAPTWYAQIATLGDENSSASRLLEEVRNASQERMKRELAALLQALSQTMPLVLFFDDLHWADVSTIDLLSFLAGKFDTMRVLILVTYRPSDLLLTKHPFLQIRPDLQARGLCRELTLDYLSLTEIETYFALEFPQHRFPPELPHLIQAKTEGNPLFMADLVRYLRDRGVLAEQVGQWMLAQPLPDLARELPESVRGMIERKIAQLSEDDRKLLVAASVQGYEFDSAVVAQALQLDAEEVEERLEKLERVFAFVKLVNESEFPNRALTVRYRFVHVLYQNELYATLRATRRATMSEAVAQALLMFYGQQSAQIASELAHLFEVARDFLRAAAYFRLASLNAVKVLATQEALTLAHRGLANLETLPDTTETQEQELALQVVLGNILSATKGFAAAEVGQTYARARALCQQLGDTPHLLPVLFGLAVNHWVSGRHRQAATLGQEFLKLAQQQQNEAVVVALRMVGGPLFSLGELTEARPYFAELLTRHDRKRHHALTYLYGQEPGAAGRLFYGWLLWLLGFPNQALQQSQEAMEIAREVAHAPSQAYALTYAAFLHQYRREPAKVRELATQVMELTTEHGLAQFSGWGQLLHGWALSESGQVEEGIAQMQRGLATSLATGTEVLRPHCLLLLAETYLKTNQVEQALATLDDMQSFVEKNDERNWEAELYRLRGECLRVRPETAGEAEHWFHLALTVAQRQSAASLALRAAMSLRRCNEAEGRKRLAEIYAGFTEGFDTPDLQAAKALLEME
ncbi:MAG: protein kinase [Blastocatellia bacterium]|nr:protein kinase [Blastocatellia bacterium]